MKFKHKGFTFSSNMNTFEVTGWLLGKAILIILELFYTSVYVSGCMVLYNVGFSERPIDITLVRVITVAAIACLIITCMQNRLNEE